MSININKAQTEMLNKTEMTVSDLEFSENLESYLIID